MALKKIFKVFTITALSTFAVSSASAQDLLAKQAPIDRRTTSIDTIIINRLQEVESYESPSALLYNDWNTTKTHSSGALPETFKIDLRGFHMPTPSRVITSNFGRRWGRAHKGLDIKVYIGDTIRAAFSGKVRIVDNEPAGYGRYIVIRHDNGLETYYGHLSKQIVRPNQIVRAGQPIGLGGNTGRSTGSHLHFETRLCGVAINPALLFDFPNQDVTGDFYTYRRSSVDRESSRASALRGVAASPGYSRENIQGKGRSNAGKIRNQQQNLNTDYSAYQPKTNNAQNEGRAAYHRVARGETLESIAERHNTSVETLYKLNGLNRFSRIEPEQEIRYK